MIAFHVIRATVLALISAAAVAGPAVAQQPAPITTSELTVFRPRSAI